MVVVVIGERRAKQVFGLLVGRALVADGGIMVMVSGPRRLSTFPSKGNASVGRDEFGRTLSKPVVDAHLSGYWKR
jgi:hypothetical protein